MGGRGDRGEGGGAEGEGVAAVEYWDWRDDKNLNEKWLMSCFRFVFVKNDIFFQQHVHTALHPTPYTANPSLNTARVHTLLVACGRFHF